MTEIEKELKRFIASGEATTKVNSGRFQTTHIDPLKIAKHFAQWQKEQIMKDAIDAVVVKPDYQARGVTKSIRLQIDDDSIACAYDKDEKVKVIIIKE